MSLFGIELTMITILDTIIDGFSKPALLISLSKY